MIESPKANKIMDNLSVGIGTLTVGQALIGETLTFGQHLSPVPDFLIHNVGDFSFFSFAQATYAIMRPNRYTQEGNEKKRRITAGIWLGMLGIAEIAPINHFVKDIIPFPVNLVLGTPDLKDIPMGIAGLAAWYGLSRSLEKRDRRRMRIR